MSELFNSLYAKTFFILSVQLSWTWFVAWMFLLRVRSAFANKENWVTGELNDDGEWDLSIDPRVWQENRWLLLILNLACFFTLLFWGEHQGIMTSSILFAAWSATMGLMLGFYVIAYDENLASRVLAITALATIGAGLFGIYSRADFSSMGAFLSKGLFILIAFGILGIFIQMPRSTQRILSGFGVLIFTLYLVYDFNRLEQLSHRLNDWETATRLAINIYLDVINLFMDLMDLMSKK